jgi:hypothetical protein
MSILYEFTKKSLVLHALPSSAGEVSSESIFLGIRKIYLTDLMTQDSDDASVAKLADAIDLGSIGAIHAGSTPVTRTDEKWSLSGSPGGLFNI